MTGEIVYLDAYCALKRGPLESGQAISSCGFPTRRRRTDHSRSFQRQASVAQEAESSRVERQVACITRLLTELEILTGAPEDLSRDVLGKARAGIAKARLILRPWVCGEAKSDLDGDSQPQLDDERLVRMYRELNPDA